MPARGEKGEAATRRNPPDREPPSLPDGRGSANYYEYSVRITDSLFVVGVFGRFATVFYG